MDHSRVEGEYSENTIETYGSLVSTHEATATVMDARVVLDRYANETYILNLKVLHAGGKKIKKILGEGDLITTEGMLTSLNLWMNSPLITA